LKRLRLYADTSVFGGYFDVEFSADTRKLFDEINSGRFILVVSATTLRELARAPDEVNRLLNEIPDDFVERISITEEMQSLRDGYVRAEVVGSSSLLDAEHIAAATVADVNLIVSWNFKHIVHFEKIRGYHAVNLMRGYRQIPIHSPKEVIEL
jgi:hypothetical protein